MLGLYVISPVVHGAESDAGGIATISLATGSTSANSAVVLNVAVETGLEPQKAQAEFRPGHLYSRTIKLT